MKNSVWLNNFAKEVNDKRNQSNQKKKVIFILLPLMMLLMLVAAMAGSDMSKPEVKMSMYAMLGVFAFVFLLVIILLSKGKKIDAAAGTIENVVALLRNDEEVDAFDKQMSAEPLNKVKLGATSDMIVTNDYIGLSFLYLGDLQYRFARIKDIAVINFTKTSAAGANPRSASYIFDIKNSEDKIMIQGISESKSMLEQMLTLLNELQPVVEIVER